MPLHVQYACLYWATHLAKAAKSQELKTSLELFVKQKLLAWLEALVMLKQLHKAVHLLLDARTWLQEQLKATRDHGDATPELLYDAYRFVLEYYEVMDNCPEQIYISALPGMPNCLLSQVYGEQQYAVLLSPRDSQWGANLRIVETQPRHNNFTCAKFLGNA
ncbi:hypothetical protein WOLCODRAFT_137965 [Wolfiporia cocos MD-104 SS10]|uniref:Uncharacterized protein n=1 Tax=Wolfiporia cocos (strain MD-104) TaxID=742152 RepID=A0A2H3JK39_WOLCO|nr:hypothetical protein WOLCODRAFT_137965 [Wolfiporia cocos MD-104 SS10]